MKVMVMVKASESSEAGVMPDAKMFEAMGAYNERLVKAGIMQSGDGLKPSKEGFRVRFDGDERVVTRGPFVETSELIAGYWVWEVNSMDEALEWVKQCPNPMPDASDIEVRPFFEFEDFAEIDGAKESLDMEEGLRNQVAIQAGKVHTYIFFAGNAEEALDYYCEHLGAKLIMMMRLSDSPDPLPEGAIPPGFENKVMHAEMQLGNATIYVSDGCDDAASRGGFSQALTVATKDVARYAFDVLATGGEVTMPLEETFWAPLYGQVKDKFGLEWMVMVEQNTQEGA